MSEARKTWKIKVPKAPGPEVTLLRDSSSQVGYWERLDGDSWQWVAPTHGGQS